MLIEIKNRWDDSVLFSHECENNTLLITLEKAVKDNARLDGARLDGARLVGARLDGASLDNARLDGARLDGARLVGASLVGASLVGARLDGARLDGARLDNARLDNARLDGARLVGASLVGASLVGARLDGARLDNARLDNASLVGARLDGASLDGASLTPIRDDIWAVLSSAPLEVPALIEALENGRVDGSTYTGECSCLVGTIAKARGVSYQQLGSLSANSTRPAECFFMGIRKGDTPETNQVSKLAHEWATEWLKNMQLAFSSVVK